MIKLPDEKLAPFVPCGTSYGLAVYESEEVEHIQSIACGCETFEFLDGGWIFDVATLDEAGHGHVMIYKPEERAAVFVAEAEVSSDAAGTFGAGVGMVAGVDGIARIVHEDGEIEEMGILQLLKNTTIGCGDALLGVKDFVEFFHGKEGMLIGGVAMVKLVLDKAVETAKFRDVLPEEAALVHHAENTADFALGVEDG